MDFNNKKRQSNASERITRSQLNPEERFLVDMLSRITERLKHNYNYSDEEILKLWNNESLLVPVVIFANGLSPAEALAKFLKENLSLNFQEISELIGRGQGSVWANYKRSVKKAPLPFEANGGISVPVSIFNCEKSVLEALVAHLKDVKKMRNRKIAQLLNKNPSNIWTVYKRSLKKNNGHKNDK